MRAEAGVLSRRLSAHGGPAVTLSAAQASLRRQLLGLLRDGALRLASEPCPCGAEPQDQPVGEIDRYGIPLRSVLCLGCGTLRFDPYLDDASLGRFYRDYYQELYERSASAEMYFETQKGHGASVLEALRAHAPHSRTVVEVGCGAGGALGVLQEAGMRIAGCDHSERLIRCGQAKGVGPLVVGDLGALAAATPWLGRVDVAYLHHVFEHLRDPAGFLLQCRPLLEPSGMVLIVVPDISRIDRFPFPAGDVRLFLHLAHKFNYSRQGLRSLGARCGYSVAFTEGFESRVAPELWALFRPDPTAKGEAAAGGGQMLRYLRRTELRYRLGLLPGYQASALQRIRRFAGTLLAP